jgi:hypothetical protein
MFTPMGKNRISDCHCVVEFPEETKPIVELVQTASEYSSEFFYHDTSHSFNDNQTVEQQIEVCHEWAKEDIDSLVDGKLAKEIDDKIARLNEVKDRLNQLKQNSFNKTV